MGTAESSAITELAKRFGGDASFTDESVHVPGFRFGKDTTQRAAALLKREDEGVITEVWHAGQKSVSNVVRAEG